MARLLKQITIGARPRGAVFLAVLAALLYGISAPASKLLLNELPPTLLAALLYLGAGGGMLVLNVVHSAWAQQRMEARITRRDAPYVAAMIVLDIAAPVLLMTGLRLSTAASAALLNNAEIVATALVALLFFGEAIGRRMWWAIGLITLACIVLTVHDVQDLSFSIGSLLVLAACVCWGFENNCTRMLSLKDPAQIVVIKGLGSGAGALAIALSLGQQAGSALYVVLALLLGLVAYGLSIYAYIMAQRSLGAARTSAYYAAAPFVGVLISWVALREELSSNFYLALGIMLAGAYLAVTERHGHLHRHLIVTHEHRHVHDDDHHSHEHDALAEPAHSHAHTHEDTEHSHTHLPDMHHLHRHD